IRPSAGRITSHFGPRHGSYHYGIDFGQYRGAPIVASASGTVIKTVYGCAVRSWRCGGGYGNNIIIQHANGTKTRYAHLRKIIVKKGEHVVQGQKIGEMGNTGNVRPRPRSASSTAGTHLHFEIRSSVNEKPTNPLLYGYEVRDATDPTLLGLYAYPLSKDALINQSEEKIQINYTKQADGSFLADKVTASGSIGFGINTFDRQDMAANQNGVYSVRQTVNGRVYSEFDFETFSFGETRYINTLIDYAHFYKFRQRIQKCFKVPFNHLSIYKNLYNDGKIDLEEGMSYNVELLISDIAGNTITLIIPVEGKKESPKKLRDDKTTSDFIIADKPNNFDLGAAKVYFPANTFYDDFYIDLKKGEDTVMIHDNSVAAHRNFTISFDPSKYPPSERDQMFIAHLDENGRPSYSKTYKRDGSFTTRTRTLGTYTLSKDSVAPSITPKNFKERQWLSNYSYLSLTISDDLSGIDTYSATLNGDWILMEYEPKTNTITYNFDDKILNATECELKVTVTDNVGNSNTFISTFFRK
ncbi:MAG: M23 family peptidase, partial [Flavobacteriia bacterium]